MSRFSLLLLEFGEIYFEDFSAICYPNASTEQESIERSKPVPYILVPTLVTMGSDTENHKGSFALFICCFSHTHFSRKHQLFLVKLMSACKL